MTVLQVFDCRDRVRASAALPPISATSKTTREKKIKGLTPRAARTHPEGLMTALADFSHLKLSWQNLASPGAVPDCGCVLIKGVTLGCWKVLWHGLK